MDRMQAGDGLYPLSFLVERDETCHEITLSLLLLITSAKRKYGNALRYCEQNERHIQANRLGALLAAVETLDKQLSDNTMLLSSLDRELVIGSLHA